MKKKIIGIALSLTLMLGLSLSLTSCGGSDGGENGTVHVYCFGDYLDPALVDQFEAETGIEVVLDTFDTNEEMYPVIKNQSAEYDVVCVSDYMVEKLMGEELLTKIDFDAIPNKANLLEKYMEQSKTFDPNNEYSVPHTWGTLGILYDTTKIKEGELKSWNDLWDKQYDGKIVMPDSMRDTLAIAMKAKGYSLNTTDEEEIKAASEYLTKQKSMVYKYANDSARDLILGGSADIAVVWSGEVLYCQETRPELEFVLPEEGSEEFIDAWVIPAASKNQENAAKWINFMLDKDVALVNYEYLTYTIPNVSVYDGVKDDAKKKDILFPADSLLEKCESLKSFPPEVEDMYSKYWKKFKS
ncbi:spermidine/putrescine transport system substrate-binding protein [Clostridiales Family XIII bacterium PM5-7]